MIKALIFDMDGTIVDNIPFHHQAWLTFLKKYRIELNQDEFHAQNHGTIDEMIIRFFGDDLPLEKITELGFEKEATYRELYKETITEVKGLTGLLEWAKLKELKIGLATMGNVDNIDFILDNLKIRSYFDAIVGGDQVVRGKPDPEIYERVLSNLEVEAGEALAFEDSHGGILAARQAGLQVIGMCTTHTPTELESWGVKSCIDDFTVYLNDLVAEFS